MSRPDKRPADYVYDGIWIGPIEDVAESDRRYSKILSVCQDTRRENVSSDVEYRHVALADDRESEANWGGSADYETFATAVDTLSEMHDSHDHENVLVHCHNGQNRSVSVVAAHIASEISTCTVDEAIELIRDKRPIANPNELMVSHAKLYVAEQ